MNKRSNLKRPLLYLLVGSVIIGAALGIVIVLRGVWNWFEIRVILTTVTVAVSSLCGLACDLSRTPRGRNLYPAAGLVMTGIATGMILVGMWADLDSEWFWKSTASVSILGVATVHICLLSIARLVGRFKWVFFVACQVIFGLALLLCVVILWEINNDRMYRFLAVLSILAAALTLVIPLLHRIGRTDANRSALLMPLAERNVAAIDQEIDLLQKRISELEKLRSEIAGGGEKPG